MFSFFASKQRKDDVLEDFAIVQKKSIENWTCGIQQFPAPLGNIALINNDVHVMSLLYDCAEQQGKEFMFRKHMTQEQMDKIKTVIKAEDDVIYLNKAMALSSDAIQGTLICNMPFMPYLFKTNMIPNKLEQVTICKTSLKCTIPLAGIVARKLLVDINNTLKYAIDAKVVHAIVDLMSTDDGKVTLVLKNPVKVPNIGKSWKVKDVELTEVKCDIYSASIFSAGRHSVHYGAKANVLFNFGSLPALVTFNQNDSVELKLAEVTEADFTKELLFVDPVMFVENEDYVALGKLVQDHAFKISSITKWNAKATESCVSNVDVTVKDAPALQLHQGTTKLKTMYYSKNGHWILKFDNIEMDIDSIRGCYAKYKPSSLKFLLVEKVLQPLGYTIVCNPIFRPVILHSLEVARIKCTLKDNKIVNQFSAETTCTATLDPQTYCMYMFSSMWYVSVNDKQDVSLIAKHNEMHVNIVGIRYFGWKVEWLQGFKVVATFKSSSSNTGKMDARGSNISMTVSQFLHLAKRIAPASLPVEVLKKNLTMFALDLDKFELIAKHFISKAGSVAITWNELHDSVVLVYEGKEYNLPFDPKQRLTPASGFKDVQVICQWDKFE